MMRDDKFNEILLGCLGDIYRHTNPPILDMDEFIKSGKGKEDGWFNNYTISESLFVSIIDRWIDQYKLGPLDRNRFRCNLYLGPTPKLI